MQLELNTAAIKKKRNKEILTNISVWTDEDIEAFEKVNG
jgi:hypothetical protein